MYSWSMIPSESEYSSFFLCLPAPWRQHLTALWQQKWMEGPYPTWQADPLPWPGGWVRHVLDFRLEMLPPWGLATLAVVPADSSTQTPQGSCTQHLSVGQLSLDWETYPKLTWVRKQAVTWTCLLKLTLVDIWVTVISLGKVSGLMTSIVGKWPWCLPTLHRQGMFY